MNHPSFPTRAMGVCPHSQTTATECGLRRWLRLVGGACLCLIATSAVRADVFSNVPEAAGYNLAYELAIPVNGAFQGATAVPYAINNAATAAPAGFDRVAYYLELTNAAGTTTWVYASMDAFTTAVTQTGLPHATNNNVSFQRSVTHLEVASNVAGVKTGSFDRCQIEMWHHSYSAADPNTVFGSSNTLFDWGDTLTTASPSGYGSFQIHNTVGRQVVLAYNRWASNSTVDDDDVGIGSSTGAQPDWTFAANAATYTSRKLVVLVRPKRFTVTLTAVPVHQQVTPRNVATNAAIVPITGTETTGGFEKAVLKVLRNGVPYGADLERTLTYSGGSAAFSFSPSITAELANYTFELYLKQGANSYLVRRISGVTAGDVFLWYGQSNAQARNFSGSANAYASPWIRTFGMSSDNATVTQAHPFWVEANGDGSLEIPAGVGQWPLVVGRKIVDTYSIPVAILNGARGGYSMLRLQRDDANLNNLADTGTTTYRVYNRLRYRALQAKVNTGVRAIFFYQGESDVNNTAQHMSGFGSLMADWQVDYPAVEKVYVTQLHVGCSTSRELPALRDAQRLIPDIYDKGRIMSTNGLTAHTDNCHYPFTGGYETHGINAFRQVARDLYGAPDAPDIDPPNPARVEMANAAGDRLRIVLRKPGATITVDPAALVDFRLNGSPAVLLSSSVTATGIELQYDRPVTGATSLDYLAHIGNAPGWVRNGNGIGLLTFSEPVPATSHPVVTLVSPTGPVEFAAGTTVTLQATAVTPAGTIARFEVFINGILHTAVNSAATVTANWKVPASGRHRVLFRATNSAGETGEASVVVFAGATASPGGVGNGLKVWLRPESGIVRDSAGVVTAWQDSSGNGNHSVQTNPIAMPDYAPQRFEVMPGVAFDGDDWLTGAAGMSTGSYTKIVRVLLSDFALTGNILSSSAASGTRHALFMSTSPQPRLWHGAIFVTSSASMTAGQGHLLTATYDSATKIGTLYLDGTPVGTGTATANTTDPTYQLGAINGANFMRGAIGEAIIFDRVLGSTERAAVEAYLATKTQAPANAPLVSYSAWSTANLPSPGNNGAEDDANGNDLANLIEFALGIDPAMAAAPKPLELTMNPGTLTVRYSRPTDRTGISYQLMESPDLVSWTAVADQRGSVTGGIEERSYSRVIGPLPKLFYKLRVVLAP